MADTEQIRKLLHYFGAPGSMQRDHVESLLAELDEARAKLDRLTALFEQEDYEWFKERAELDDELERALNQARHWKEQEAKQRRLHHEQGDWKHRALAAEGRTP